MIIVVITGGFDPVHCGHIAMIKEAATMGDRLIVGVNSDTWLARKKGRSFMPIEERLAVLNAMEGVYEAVEFDDSDGSACALLEQLKISFPYATIIFANGGDRTAANIPEMSVKNIIFKFGIGGENKANSSSWILQEWKAPKTNRPWGYYQVLHEVPGMKVKELTVMPGQQLSMQRHKHRNEYWIVSEGTATIDWNPGRTTLKEQQSETILVGEWHQLINNTDDILRIVEIQYGTLCEESDIERKP